MKSINICMCCFLREVSSVSVSCCECRPVFVWRGVEAPQLLAGWFDAVIPVDQLLWHPHSCPKQSPHTSAHTHTRTHILKHTLSDHTMISLFSPFELACSDDENRSVSQTEQRVSDWHADTQSDQSEDIEWLHDPPTSRVTSTVEHKTFIFHQRQVNLQFIYNPDTEALKRDRSNERKAIKRHLKITLKEEKQSTLRNVGIHVGSLREFTFPLYTVEYHKFYFEKPIE